METAVGQMDLRPMSRLQKRSALLVAMGEFIDGYDLLVIGAALIFLGPHFHLSPAATGLLGGASFLGSMVGLLIFGDMSDRLGRRAIFVVNLLFFVVFSILSAFITNSWELFLTRFLVGVGIGMDIPTSTAYLAEIAPKKQRGAILGALPQIMWTLGALCSTLIAIPLFKWTGNEAWRWMFALAAVPSLLVLIGRQTLPESPRWLLSHGKADEAAEVFKSFGITGSIVAVQEARASYTEIFRKPVAKRTGWVSFIFFLNCLSGPIATVATPYVLRYVGTMSVSHTLLFSALVWVTDLLGAIGSFILIDRLGRKRLTYLSLIPSGIFAILMGILGGHNPTMLVTIFFLFGFFNWLGAPALQWGWSSELFPTRLRGKSQGFCNATCRFAISLNIFLVPVALATIGFESFLILLSIPLFIYAIVVNRFAFFESANISLDDISMD